MALDTCRILGFAAIGAGYVAVGGPAQSEGRMLLLQNWTDGDLMFSDDPLDAVGKFPLKAGDKIILDCSTNQTFNRGFFWNFNSILYVKQITAPSSGNVYFSLFYGN